MLLMIMINQGQKTRTINRACQRVKKQCIYRQSGKLQQNWNVRDKPHREGYNKRTA